MLQMSYVLMFLLFYVFNFHLSHVFMFQLSYAEYFHNGESYWILPTGEIYSAAAMRKILNDNIVDTIMVFSDKFNALGLQDLEVAILCAVCLTKTGTPLLMCYCVPSASPRQVRHS